MNSHSKEQEHPRKPQNHRSINVVAYGLRFPTPDGFFLATQYNIINSDLRLMRVLCKNILEISFDGSDLYNA